MACCGFFEARVLFEAVPLQREELPSGSTLANLSQESALANPGFARHEHDLPSSSARLN
jgi:hypothetical protein